MNDIKNELVVKGSLLSRQSRSVYPSYVGCLSRRNGNAKIGWGYGYLSRGGMVVFLKKIKKVSLDIQLFTSDTFVNW